MGSQKAGLTGGALPKQGSSKAVREWFGTLVGDPLWGDREKGGRGGCVKKTVEGRKKDHHRKGGSEEFSFLIRKKI